jgi:hypothetical protein
MESIIVIVKQHPIPIALGVIVLLVLISSRSAPTVTAAQGSTLAERQIAANSNSQIAGINAQTAIALGAQSSDQNKTAMAQATARTAIMANLFAAVTGTSAAAAMNDSTNQLKTIQAQFARADNNQLFSNNMKLGEDTISAGVAMKSKDLDTQIAMNRDNINGKLAAIGAATSGNIGAIMAQGKNLLDLQGADLAFKDKNLSSLLQNSENIAKISGANAQAMATIQANAATTIAGINTSAARTAADAQSSSSKSSSNMAWVGTVAEIAAMFFA